MAGWESVRSNAGMLLSDEALLDVSSRCGPGPTATLCWFAWAWAEPGRSE